MKPKSNGVKVVLTIDRDVVEQAREEAAKDNRPLSNFVETILMRYFAAKDGDSEA